MAAASRWPVRGLPLLFEWAFPKATLGILDRPPTLLGSWQACLFSSDGLLKATLGILDRPQTVLGSWQACLFSWPVSGLPLLFLWASESNVRHCGPPPNPSRQLAGLPATFWKPLSAAGRPASSLGLSQACLFSSYGLPRATLGIVDPPKPFLAAGRPASNVRHFGPPPNRSRQLAGLPLLFACSRPASSVLMGFRKQR